MPIIQNSLHTRAVTRDTANVTYSLANFALPGETVNSVDIAQVYWCGTWNITRNGNTILQLVGGDNWFLEGVTLLKEQDTGDVTLSNAGANGSIIIVYKKNTVVDQNY